MTTDYLATNFSQLSRFYKMRKGKHSSEKYIPKRMIDLTKYVEIVDTIERDSQKNSIEFSVFDFDFWVVHRNLLEELASDIVRRPISINIKRNAASHVELKVKKRKKADIVLFSGGLDSFLAAYENKDAILVHVNRAKVMRQFAIKAKSLLGKRKYHEVAFTPKTNQGTMQISNSRGLAFISLASLFTPAFQSDKIIVGENGLLMYNPPIFEGADITQGLAPPLVEKIQKLLQAVYEKEIEIEFPNKKLTKKEVIEKISNNGIPLRKLLGSTHSCAQQQPRRDVKGIKMCGLCYACIVRRISLLANHKDESRNYIKNPFQDHEAKGNGILHMVDLCRFIMLYKKGLLSTRQMHAISQDVPLFERYFDEVIAALKYARTKGLTTDSMIEERITELEENSS